MKKNKIIYWITTGLLSLMMLGSAMFYLTQTPTATQIFNSLGFPAYLIYPLALAKILGVLAILTNKSDFLKDLAYKGFFYVFILAASAHINAGDGGFAPALIALLLVITSYLYNKKLRLTTTP
ncbi:DoxX family protein [Spongiimicrobium sp. 3-5]|uniref:DoxX family protein n=1 Tax=Spongiimicrobium sp. 3-5 TaxID=3332596 RepID=UPI00397FB84E